MLMVVKKNLLLMFIRFKYNLLANLEYPINFIFQILGMLLNNIIFIISWKFIFQKYADISGYSFNDIMGLYSISMTSFGLAYLLFGNLGEISRMTINNEIDAYILQPPNTLFSLISSKSDIVAIGDIICGLCLFLLYYSLKKFHIFLYCIMCSTVIIASFIILLESLSFRLKFSHSINSLFYDIIQNLNIYPESIYNTGTRIIIKTVLPAFFISHLPQKLLVNFSYSQALVLLLVTIIWFVSSYLYFFRVLKHYESGSSININL